MLFVEPFLDCDRMQDQGQAGTQPTNLQFGWLTSTLRVTARERCASDRSRQTKLKD